MPLKPSHILALLRAKQAEFQQFDQTTIKALRQYHEAIADVSQWPLNQLIQALDHCAQDPLGAFPLEPFEPSQGWIKPFGIRWRNREESMAWVRDRLTGIATFAVDGSQIFPGKDLSLPIALIQIGWYENRHLPQGHYEKDIAVDILTPADLQANHTGEPVDRRVNMRRFQMETQRLCQYMQDHAHCEDCLVFLDGSLIATFADAFDRESRQFYIHCLLHLLRTSEQCRVPLVAYIDTTFARDLTVMLQNVAHLPAADKIQDAQLLAKSMQWGDRTAAFISRRGTILNDYQEQTRRIAFTYLKTTHDGYPVRLEFPLWVYEAGWLDRVMDWVRGEVIIGSGYPYVIETADQTAVLKGDDRQAFYRILQDWAIQSNLDLRLSRKMVSKVRRR